MPDLLFWLYFVTAFTIVVAVLMIGAATHEWWSWKKEQSVVNVDVGPELPGADIRD